MMEFEFFAIMSCHKVPRNNLGSCIHRDTNRKYKYGMQGAGMYSRSRYNRVNLARVDAKTVMQEGICDALSAKQTMVTQFNIKLKCKSVEWRMLRGAQSHEND